MKDYLMIINKMGMGDCIPMIKNVLLENEVMDN